MQVMRKRASAISLPLVSSGVAHSSIVALFLLPIVLSQARVFANLLTSFNRSSNAATQSPLASWCQNGLDFVSLAEFSTFIEQFKAKSVEMLRQEKVSSACLKHREAIIELEHIVQKRNVCEPSKIDTLVDYHERYIARHSFLGTSLKKPIMARFFAKYAIQVAHVCKKNLIENLLSGHEELKARSKVFDEARERIFHDEPSIKSNIKLIEEQPDEPMATNVKPKDDAEMMLSEYREALTKLKRPEDILTINRRQCERSSTRRIKIAKDKVQTFFKPSMMCLQLARYYGGSILSIAKLANVGYIATDEELDIKLADSSLVRNWIIAAQVCEPMLYMRSEKVDSEWATIDTCSERVDSIEAMVFEDNLEELDNEALAEMLPKSEATRNSAQKIMKSAMKKMAKINLKKELESGNIKKRSIFSKSLRAFPSASTMMAMQMDSGTNSYVSRQVLNGAIDISSLNELSSGQSPDEESFEELMKVLSRDSTCTQTSKSANPDDGEEQAVSAFDPMSSLISSLTILAVMLIFEWLFFIVMTLAARICYHFNFNFDNILTFPPKVLSWSDADFTQFNLDLDKIDEDDFFEYDELSPDEQKQRDMLAKVFGKPPPMLFKG